MQTVLTTETHLPVLRLQVRATIYKPNVYKVA